MCGESVYFITQKQENQVKLNIKYIIRMKWSMTW